MKKASKYITLFLSFLSASSGLLAVKTYEVYSNAPYNLAQEANLGSLYNAVKRMNPNQPGDYDIQTVENPNDRILAFKSLADYKADTLNQAAVLPNNSLDLGTYIPANNSNLIDFSQVNKITLQGPTNGASGKNTIMMQNSIVGLDAANGNTSHPIILNFYIPNDAHDVAQPLIVGVTSGDGGIKQLNLFATQRLNIQAGQPNYIDKTFYLTGIPAVAAVGQAPTGNQNLILSQDILPQGTDASNYTFTGSVAGADANGHPTLGGTFVKNGAGTLILGQNSVTPGVANNTINMQTVRVQEGTLVPNVQNMFAYGGQNGLVPQTVVDIQYSAPDAANNPNGSTLKLGANQQFAGLTSSGAADRGGNLDTNGYVAGITVPDGIKSTFSGLIKDSSANGAGGITVNKASPTATGIQDIRIGATATAGTDINTYEGPTTVNGILVADSRSLPQTSPLTVSQGGLLEVNQSKVNAAIDAAVAATAGGAQNQLPATATEYAPEVGIQGAGTIQIVNSPAANPIILAGANSTFTGEFIVDAGQQVNFQKDGYFQGANNVLPSIQNNGTVYFNGQAAVQGANGQAAQAAQNYTYTLSSMNSISGPNNSNVVLNNANLVIFADGTKAYPFNNNGPISNYTGTNNNLGFSLEDNVAINALTATERTFKVSTPISISNFLINTGVITSLQDTGLLNGTRVTLNQGSNLQLNGNATTLTDLISNAPSVVSVGQTGGRYTGTYSADSNFNTSIIGTGDVIFAAANNSNPVITWGNNGAAGSTFTGTLNIGDSTHPIKVTLDSANLLSPSAVVNLEGATLNMGAFNQEIAGLTGLGLNTIDMDGSSLTFSVPANTTNTYLGKFTSAANNLGFIIKGGTGTQEFTGVTPLVLKGITIAEGQQSVNSTVVSYPVAGAGPVPSIALVGPNVAPASGIPTISFQQGANDAAISYINPVGSLSGALNFSLASGNLTVQGALPTYTGATTIAAGATLSAPVEGWFENTNTAAPFVLNGILDLAGQDQLVNNLQGSAQAIVQNTNAAGTNNIFSINQLIGNADGSVSQFEGNITTNIDFHKSGLFPVALVGNNSYTGSTIVDQGLLYVNTNSLPSNSTVNINTAPFLGIDGATPEETYTATVAFVEGIDANNIYASGLEGLVFNQTGTTTYSATENAYYGTVTGTGDIFKVGQGALNLTGDFTNWGDADGKNTLYVKQGIVAVNGYMPNGVIYVCNGAVLKGGAPDKDSAAGFMMPGIIVGNGGTFAPGNSIGYTPIQFLTLSPESIFKVEISSTGASTQVASVGNVDLDGILAIIPANDGEYNVGTEYLNVITTQEELNGTFNTIFILGFELSNPNDLITYVPGLNGSVSLTLTQEAINIITGVRDQNIPQFAESNAFLTMSNLGQQKNLFANRMSLLSSSPEYATGAWATPYWNTMRLKSTDGTVACKSNTEGFTFGKDMIVENGALLGAALGYENTHAKYKNDSAKANMNSLHAGIYANYEVEQMHFEAVVSGLVSRNKYKRDVSVKTATIQSDVGQNKGKNYSFGGEVSLLAGYVMPYEAASFMPYVGVNFYGTRENKFTETSTKQLFSTIKRRNTVSIEEELGLRTDVQFGRVSLLTDLSIARSHFIHDSGSKSLYQDSTKIDQSRNLRYNYPIEVRALVGMGYKHSNTISYELAASVKARRSKFETSLMGSISIAM